MSLPTYPIDTLTVGTECTVWKGCRGQGGRVVALSNGEHGTPIVDIVSPVGETVRMVGASHFTLASDEHAAEAYRRRGWEDAEHDAERLTWTAEGNALAEHLADAYDRGYSDGLRYGERNADSLARYADSDVAPTWFDPTACGERWDDDY